MVPVVVLDDLRNFSGFLLNKRWLTSREKEVACVVEVCLRLNSSIVKTERALDRLQFELFESEGDLGLLHVIVRIR